MLDMLGMVTAARTIFFNAFLYRYSCIRMVCFSGLLLCRPLAIGLQERCLDFLLASKLPGCALMPNYVANKQYFRERIASRAEQGDVAYIVPSTKYEFDHPTGKGHATSPFFSIWFLFIPGQQRSLTGHMDARTPPPYMCLLIDTCATASLCSASGCRAKGGWEWLSQWLKKHPDAGWRLVRSVQELQGSGSAPSWKRPSNKQRKKLKMRREAAAAAAKGT